MKIGQTPELPGGPTPPPAKRTGQDVDAATAAKSAAAKPNAGAAVSVSTLARGLESARSDASDIDRAKVDAVRASIEDGSYVVDPEAIADKMLANAQEMLKPKVG